MTNPTNRKDAAAALGVSETQLRKWFKADGFPKAVKGTYDLEAIADWVEKHPAGDSDQEGGLWFLPNNDMCAVSPEESPEKTETEFLDVTIQIPIGEPSGYVAKEKLAGTFEKHVAARVNNPEQLLGLRMAHAGCQAGHVQLLSGKHIDSRANLIKYILEQIGVAAQKQLDERAKKL